eukprot:scaffold131694_cov66-Phaeocystis_antarctica.AAC.1
MPRSLSCSTDTDSLDGSTADLLLLAALTAAGGSGASLPSFSVSSCSAAAASSTRCRFCRAAGACCCCRTSRSGLSLQGSPALWRLAHASAHGGANAHASASSSSDVSPPSPAAKRGGGDGGTARPIASESSATTLWRRCRLLVESALARQYSSRPEFLARAAAEPADAVAAASRRAPASRTLLRPRCARVRGPPERHGRRRCAARGAVQRWVPPSRARAHEQSVPVHAASTGSEGHTKFGGERQQRTSSCRSADVCDRGLSVSEGQLQHAITVQREQ